VIFRLFYRCLIVFLCLGSGQSYAKYEMHFFCPDFPPYTTVDSTGRNVGTGLDKIKPVLDSMGVTYTIEIGSNHGRALAELKSGRSDGFFMASQNKERDKYAVFSESVMINRWVWIVLSDQSNTFSSTPKPGYLVASLLNTNTERWLTSSGFTLGHSADNIESLIAMLDSRQVNAVLVAEEVYNVRYKDHPNYKVILQEEKEFGVYVSRIFLRRHPQFMEEFNRTIRMNRQGKE